MKILYKRLAAFFIVLFLLELFGNSSFAEILNSWKDDRAYRPYPVLFLHGFAAGDYDTWRDEKEGKINISEKLYKYFEKYFNRSKTFEYSEFPYLELISFIDANNRNDTVQSLIDRNSSINTYQADDYYVGKGFRNAGDPGWVDKVNAAVDTVLSTYQTDKVILVAHSMGGLAARGYITNPNYGLSYTKVKRLITIDTPHLGSVLATTAKAATQLQKIGWFVPCFGWIFSVYVVDLDATVQLANKIDLHGDAVNDMVPGSSFLTNLNLRDAHCEDVKYYAISGQYKLLPGDGVVSLVSQRAEGVLTLSDEALISSIHASHGNMPSLSVAGNGSDMPLLRFIDSTKPEMEITSPAPNTTTEIYESSVRIQGKVFKEYLPADSELNIDVVREEDGSVRPTQSGVLKPSDLWIPNNPDSPVAEFDELINFSRNGTYKIFCYVKNPAGLVSGVKDTRVLVSVKEPIIENISPLEKTGERKPTIQARIYSPNNSNIDLSTISMILDGSIIIPTITPQTGGPDITITYSPLNDLSIGQHTVTIDARDTNGLAANQKVWAFSVIDSTQNTQIIVHCHNPEGVEINSIAGVGILQEAASSMEYRMVAVYDGEMSIGSGVCNEPILIEPGFHMIKAVFNGMTLSSEINIIKGETKILTFTFSRDEFDIVKFLEDNYAGNVSLDWNYEFDSWHPFTNFRVHDEKINGALKAALDIDIFSGMSGITKGNFQVSYDVWSYYMDGKAELIWNLPYYNIEYHVNAHVSSIYFSESKIGNPIYIPSQHFNCWFVQSVVDSEYYPWICLLYLQDRSRTISLIYRQDVDQYQSFISGYHNMMISAKNEYKYIYVDCLNIAYGLYLSSGQLQSKRQQGFLSFLKMSSVPYDVTGVGVK